MSFIRFKKEPQFEEVKQEAASNELNIRIDVAPIPLGASNEVSMEKRRAQTLALESIRKDGKDLFQPNSTAVTNTAGDRLYQTKDLYGQNLSVEKLLTKLTANDLTLRVNALRTGTHAQSTCMELKTGIMADLLAQAKDSNDEKTTTLSIENASEKGEMFVSMREIKGEHYINKVDYKISAAEDDRLHVI
tara:strand:- start:23 stop:592 length:570 start_codon:yes stop_codon:yes gene_type:complete